MKTIFITLMVLAMAAPLLRAEVRVLPDLTTVEGRLYKNPEVISQNEASVRIKHSGGIEIVGREELTGDWAKLYPATPLDAAHRVQREANLAETAAQRAIAEAEAEVLKMEKLESEVMPQLKTGDGKVFTKARITRLDGDSVRIMHDGGIEDVAVSNLPAEVRSKIMKLTKLLRIGEPLTPSEQYTPKAAISPTETQPENPGFLASFAKLLHVVNKAFNGADASAGNGAKAIEGMHPSDMYRALQKLGFTVDRRVGRSSLTWVCKGSAGLRDFRCEVENLSDGDAAVHHITATVTDGNDAPSRDDAATFLACVAKLTSGTSKANEVAKDWVRAHVNADTAGSTTINGVTFTLALKPRYKLLEIEAVK